MNKEELIQKLEKIKIPEIELTSHKRKLRAYLLSQYSKKEAFIFLKRVFPVSLAFIILFVLVFNIFTFQKTDLAMAKNIAVKDPRFRSLIEEGGIIKETQLADSKAYMLVRVTKEIEMSKELPFEAYQDNSITVSATDGGGLATEFLIEIDFKSKKISQIKELALPNPFLSEQDKEKITLISEESEAIKKAIPQEAVIEEIKPDLLQTKLVKKGNKVEAESAIKATVIYKADGKKWQAMIDFEENKVESIEFLGEQGK